MTFQEAVDVLCAWTGRPVIVARSSRRSRAQTPRKGVWRRRSRRRGRRATFGLDEPGGRPTAWTAILDAGSFVSAHEHADHRGLTIRARDRTLIVLLDDTDRTSARQALP